MGHWPKGSKEHCSAARWASELCQLRYAAQVRYRLIPGVW
jgi:hypothetical protein